MSLLQERNIDYWLLNFAIEHYTKLNYTQIEVPWLVSKEACFATCPFPEGAFATTKDEYLVGSAEQGFIEMMITKNPRLLSNKKYFSVSPCFRCDTLTNIHSQTFLKLELFYQCSNDDNCNDIILHEMLDHAKSLFHSLNLEIEEIYQDGVMDLMCQGIEIGSYGVRKYKDNHWIFGTGLALPRTQLVKF